MLNFPTDHYSHNEAKSECWTIAGILENNYYFHCAMFKVRTGSETSCDIHSSFSGKSFINFFEETDDELEPRKTILKYLDGIFVFESPQFNIKATPCSYPIVHNMLSRDGYYTITDLDIVCTFDGKKIKGNGWLEHEWFETVWKHLFQQQRNRNTIIANWEWLGAKLFSGVRVIIYRVKGREDYNAVILGGNLFHPIINVEQQNGTILLDIPEFKISIDFRPIYKERIFRPKVGIKYSKTPMLVYQRGTDHLIGDGECERTYGGEKVDESKVINSELIRR